MGKADGHRLDGIFYEECGPFPTSSQAVKDAYLKLFNDAKPTTIFTMESKYYTPTIEEFHVGFEGESNYVLINRLDFPASNEFIPFTFDEANFGYLLDAYLNDAYPTEFRVKYLDKEDIESLGWRNVEDRGMSENYGYSFEKPIQYLSGGNAYYRLRYWFTNHRVRIEPLGGPIFEGTIKNKSELKVLLEQLGI